MEIFQGDLVRKEEFADANCSSTVRCGKCDSYITAEQEDYLFRSRDIEDDECHMCGMSLDEESVIADVHPDSEYLLDIQNAKDEFWFHATNRADWMGDLLDDKDEEDGSVPVVHVGTLAAAMNIMADRYARSTEMTYLYRVRLAPDAVIDTDLYEDENLWPDRTNEIDCYANAYRYVNRWEATGSISMLVDPERLIIDRVTPLFPEEVRAEIAKFPRLRQSEIW
jgi:hypothetical protein